MNGTLCSLKFFHALSSKHFCCRSYTALIASVAGMKNSFSILHRQKDLGISFPVPCLLQSANRLKTTHQEDPVLENNCTEYRHNVGRTFAKSDLLCPWAPWSPRTVSTGSDFSSPNDVIWRPKGDRSGLHSQYEAHGPLFNGESGGLNARMCGN